MDSRIVKICILILLLVSPALVTAGNVQWQTWDGASSGGGPTWGLVVVIIVVMFFLMSRKKDK